MPYQTLPTVVSGEPIQSAEWGNVIKGNFESMPRGILGHAEATSNQASISTIVDLTNLSIAVTVAASRRIKITAIAYVQQITSNGVPGLRIREGSTTLQRVRATLATNDMANLSYAVVLNNPSAGAHTYKLSLETTAGTVTLIAGSAEPAQIIVEDIGPA